MRKLLLVLAAAAILATACATSGTSPSASGASYGSEGAAGKALPPQPGTPQDAVTGTTPDQGIPTLNAVGRDLIMTANVTMRSRDPWATADQARAIAAGLGGDLLALSQTRSGDQRKPVLTVRVPSDRFDDALTQLKKLDGEVVTSNVAATDVTDQFVDLQARLSAKKAEEQSYLSLLNKASTVDEILKVQNALYSVRTQIEQLQGQVNGLKTRIDYSTITMSVSPLVPVTGPTGTWDPSVTFAQAIAALGSMFRALADVAIWVLVFGWIPLLALALLFAAMRVRRPATAS